MARACTTDAAPSHVPAARKRRKKMRIRRRSNFRSIRASDLAKMTVCEQKLVFEKHYGERLTRAQRVRPHPTDMLPGGSGA